MPIHLIDPNGRPWTAGTPAEANDLLTIGYRRSQGPDSTEAAEGVYGVGISPVDVFGDPDADGDTGSDTDAGPAPQAAPEQPQQAAPEQPDIVVSAPAAAPAPSQTVWGG